MRIHVSIYMGIYRIVQSICICAVQWVDAYTVAALDPKEHVHLLSVKDDSEVEVFDLARVELVYNSSFFKSIETGGNVSRALVRLVPAGPTATYYVHVRVFKGV